jgi:alginate O-acetyltransferase complex protein AlgI
MVFTSWAFVIFFLSFLLVLNVVPNRWARQLTILVGSICFYGYWNKWYLLLLLTPSVIDYICALRIADSANSRVRKLWLWISLVSNLGLLGYFKYANFFLESSAHFNGRPFVRLDILLPIGISFYTFKTMSYTIDVYRGEIPVCRDWWRYAMFVTYFPELIAGPIVRASVFLPQMTRSLRPSWARSWVGLQLILLGVTKKLLIADKMAVLSDAVFAHAKIFAPATVMSGIVAYSLQIYCDFSGYSDIAIGISRIIGFDLPENFNMPYLATSVTDFWRRWHITLSQWLRDYLYIPLGGNRKGELPHLSQSDAYDAARRSLAWRELDVCRVGRIAWSRTGSA